MTIQLKKLLVNYRRRWTGVALEVEILPVEYGIVDRVLAKPRHRDVAGVFMLGAAGEAEFGRLEVQAFNWKSSSVSDNSGNLELGRSSVLNILQITS